MPQQQTKLRMWTIYDHPLDYPDNYVVRGFTVQRDGPIPDQHAQLAKSLDAARLLVPQGLYCLRRSPDDDPFIVETWV